MRVLVLWADDQSANLGVRALAQGTAEIVSDAWNKPEVVFQDLGPNSDGFRVSIDLIKKDVGRPNGPIKRWLRSFDAVIDTGAGDSFADIYGRNRLARIVYTQLAARRIGLPVILSPQTIGPFSGLVNRTVARHALGRASSVFARDSASYDYARSIGARRVERATDVVFALPVPERLTSRDVIVNVSGLLWQENRHVDHVAYRESAQRLVAGLISSGRRVSLLAHVIDNPTKDNDLVAMRPMQTAFGEDVELLMPNSLDEVREMLASAELVVGSRMHACLNAIAVGTPAIPWAYSRKFAPLLSDLKWPISVDLRAVEAPESVTLGLIGDDETRWDELLVATRSEANRRIRLFSQALSAQAPRLVGV